MRKLEVLGSALMLCAGTCDWSTDIVGYTSIDGFQGEETAIPWEAGRVGELGCRDERPG
jgi:hypothetical protein